VNQQQIESLMRVLLAAGGPIAGLLVGWGVPTGQVNNYLTIGLIVLPPLVSAVWGLVKNTHSATALAAQGIKGVQVFIDPHAAPISVIETALKPTNDLKMEPS
jgi:hypothetical protein